MRVLYYTDSLRCGGKERQLIELLKGLRQRDGIEVLVACMDQGAFYEPDVRALAIPLKHLLRKARWDPVVLWNFYHLVRSFNPDVIHTNSMMTSAYALPIAKLFRIPLVNGSIRNCFQGYTFRWKLERMLMVWSDFRVANSTAGLRSRGFVPDSLRNAVIHNGIDLSRLGKTESQSRSFKCETAKIGMVAQFRPDKDFRTFVLAALRLLKTRPNLTFVAVGDGGTLEETKKLARDAGERIQFLGRRKDIDNVVRSLSIGVLSTFTEGISNSLMEYMMMAKPVVTTDCSGSRELVVNGETGFLVPPQDPLSLANKIIYLLDHPVEAERMGQAGKKHIEEHFSLASMVDKTIEIYKRATQCSKTHSQIPSTSSSHLRN